ncbi:hypothetical protein N7456_003638 [Penicillium angulare]|uniref:Uncharacterized protein n=1 Tax=Penicillium angulare TaxID=116970 RepID=A0A9W9KIT2_9EURO|nr:hypothetical protein N7456_003638 [Penicillium angulare]
MPSFHGGKRSDSPYDNTPTKKKTKDLMVERVSEELEGCGSFFKGNLQLGWADQEQNPSTQQEIQQSIRHQILGALQNRVHIILARRDLSRRHLEQQQVEQHGTGQHRLHPPRQTNFTVQISITSACGKFTQGCSPDAKAILHKYSSSDENNSNEQAPM